MAPTSTPSTVRGIVVDTRERDPWDLSFLRGVAVVRRKLPAGDYTVAGFEHTFAVERKSADDLVRTLVHDRDRFFEEMRLLAAMRRAWVVVEASLHEFLAGRALAFPTGATPSSVLETCSSLSVDWGVPVLWAGNRGAAARQAASLMMRAVRRYGADERAPAASEYSPEYSQESPQIPGGPA